MIAFHGPSIRSITTCLVDHSDVDVSGLGEASKSQLDDDLFEG